MTQVADEIAYVGRGWQPILLQLHRELLALDPFYEISQVKEKFGNLRVYVINVTWEMQDRINFAINMASITCERCGQVGEVREQPSGWLKTLCQGCLDELWMLRQDGPYQDDESRNSD